MYNNATVTLAGLSLKVKSNTTLDVKVVSEDLNRMLATALNEFSVTQ